MARSLIKNIIQKKGEGFFGSMYEEIYLNVFQEVLKKKIEAAHNKDFVKIADKLVEIMDKHYACIDKKSDTDSETSELGNELIRGRKEIRELIDSLDK